MSLMRWVSPLMGSRPFPPYAARQDLQKGPRGLDEAEGCRLDGDLAASNRLADRIRMRFSVYQ